MKKLLVLPGSRWQLELVKKIKEMGHTVYVISPEQEPPCKAFSDGFLRSDIFDEEKIDSYIEVTKPDGVISDECDIAMPVVARLGEKYGWSTLSRGDAALFTDKYLMREFSAQNGFPVPKYKLCRSKAEAIAFFQELNAPLILKPLDSNSSHGVFTVASLSDLEAHFDESLSFSRIEKAVLAEQYINGTEFTVDGIKTPDNHYTLAISQKHHFLHNQNIADELYFTHQNPNFDYEALKRTNDAFVMASGLKFGFTHAEYKYEDGQFYMIEIAARGGGNMISSIITQYMSGHDTYPYLINCALGNFQKSDFSVTETQYRAAVLKFFVTPKVGIVKRIEGLDCLENNLRVACYRLNFKVGDRIQNCVSDSARIGFYIACAESERELKETMATIKNNFSVVVK